MRILLRSTSVRPALIALALLSFPRPSGAEDAPTIGAGGPLFVQVDGRFGGYLSTFQPPSYEIEDVNQAVSAGGKKMMGAPKIGEATAVLDISQSAALQAWVASASQGIATTANLSVRLADQDYNIKRGIDMGACVITGIEWPELKASDGKKHFEVTAKWQAQELRFTDGGSGTKPEPQEMSNWTSFTVTTPGLKTEWITSIKLPKITPKISKESHGKFRTAAPAYDAIEFGTIKIEIGAAGYRAAADMATQVLKDGTLDATEFQDILIDMKDQSLKTVGTFVVRAGLKKFDWSPKLEGGKEGLATSTMEFMVEDFRFQVSPK